MKKNFVILSMIALVALVAGCKKESNPTSLPVTIEQYNGGDKVYIDNSNYACWHNGDIAQVNGYNATISSDGPTDASIDMTSVTSGSPYYAVYPASRVTDYPSAGTYSVTLPDTQNYRVDASGNQIVNGIMAAHGTTHLAFKNLTALVKVTFTNSTGSPITVGSVKVSTTASGQYLSGSGTVTVASSGSHTLSLASGSQSVSLVVNQSVAASATFYVVVPAFANKAIKVEVLTPNGAYTKSSSSATLARNDMGLLTIATSSSTLDATKGVTNGHEWVQLWSGGPKWATCNVGATTATGYGDFYAWGEVETYYTSLSPSVTWKTGKDNGYAEDSYRYYSEGSYTKYTDDDGKTELETDPDDDAAHFNWGGDWRMPTTDEFNDLEDECTWTWQSNYNGTGVKGYLVTGSTTSYTGNSIFLPAAGWFDGTSRYLLAMGGSCYWSSTRSSGAAYAYGLYFEESGKDQYSYARYLGHTVRPVRD